MSEIEMMVVVSNPKDFDNWSDDKKRDRLRRVLLWHDYIAKLNPVKVPQVWGSHQALSQTRLSSVQDVKVAVYRTKSLTEFNHLLAQDPLRTCSRYATFLLSPLRDDQRIDTKRLESAKAQLFGNSETEDEADAERIFKTIRAEFKNAPDFVRPKAEEDDTRSSEPPNLPVTYFDDKAATPQLDVLIYGMNPPEYHAWSDARKLVHFEKVLWWHEHIADMLEKKKVSHVWGTHDFCDVSEPAYRSAGAATVYSVNDLDEWDEIYKLDPLRESGRFWSVVLQPISDERELDEVRLREFERTLAN